MEPSRLPCLVDGCEADLILCRDYYARHKVCETHSKTPIVTIDGEPRRFCQQCSRFHSLDEFDGVKRSCRKRLEDHNRRRRKPKMDFTVPNPTLFFPNHPSSFPQFNDAHVMLPNQHHGMMSYNENPDYSSSYNYEKPALSLLSTPQSLVQHQHSYYDDRFSSRQFYGETSPDYSYSNLYFPEMLQNGEASSSNWE